MPKAAWWHWVILALLYWIFWRNDETLREAVS